MHAVKMASRIHARIVRLCTGTGNSPPPRIGQVYEPRENSTIPHRHQAYPLLTQHTSKQCLGRIIINYSTKSSDPQIPQRQLLKVLKCQPLNPRQCQFLKPNPRLSPMLKHPRELPASKVNCNQTRSFKFTTTTIPIANLRYPKPRL